MTARNSQVAPSMMMRCPIASVLARWLRPGGKHEGDTCGRRAAQTPAPARRSRSPCRSTDASQRRAWAAPCPTASPQWRSSPDAGDQDARPEELRARRRTPSPARSSEARDADPAGCRRIACGAIRIAKIAATLANAPIVSRSLASGRRSNNRQGKEDDGNPHRPRLSTTRSVCIAAFHANAPSGAPSARASSPSGR